MTPAGGRRALVTALMLVAGMRLWMQLRGKTKTPFAEWAIGWGALFFLLSMLSEASPEGAGGLALLLAVGDVLTNGASLITDVSSTITSAEKPGSSTTFVPEPFADTSSSTTPATATTRRKAGMA